MAAPRSFCRIMLSIKGQGAYQSENQWHSIDFAQCKTVNCSINKILRTFKIKCVSCELYMRDIVIPKWETCAYVFRDNDEVELRYVAEGGDHEHSSTVLAEFERNQSLPCITGSSPGITGSSPKDNSAYDSDYERKPKKKKRKSKHVQEAEPQDTNAQIDLLGLNDNADTAGFSNTSLKLPACLTSPQAKLDTKEVASAESLEETDASVEQENRKKARQAARTAQLTPIEQQLIAELESQPNAKRHRKRKRKRAKQDAETSATEVQKTEKPAVIGPIRLNSSYHGKKKVFDSDDQCETHDSTTITDVTDGVGRAELAHKSWEQIHLCKIEDVESLNKEPQLPQADKVVQPEQSWVEEESRSCVKVTPRGKSPVPVLSSSQAYAVDADAPTPVTDTSTPEFHPAASSGALPTHSSSPSSSKQRFSNFANKKGSDSHHRPVVYKRERLKLRATISPAVQEQLQKVTVNGCDAEPENSRSKPLSGAQSHKGFKWHQSKVSNSTPKASTTKTQQLSDDQTNISSIQLCNSSQDASQAVSATVEPKDYSSYPDLDGPPRAGDRIAFKRLEVSADYTPIVSEYKEAVVLSYEPKSKLVHVKVTSAVKQPKRNGVFDIHIEKDGETLTNVEDNQDEIVDALTTFLQAKLLPSLRVN